MSDRNEFLANIRRALGRSEPLAEAPKPPAIDEPVVRLVHTDLGLPELFARMARGNGMEVDPLHVEDLAERVVAFLREKGCRSVAIPESVFLKKLMIPEALREAGFDVRAWPTMTLDEMYEVDCGLTDAYAAVAETGSIVVRATPEHGRAISLVAPIHVAILQPKDFVADLLDLCERLAKDPSGSGTILISGPSKTADIEMNLVVGVHGPGVVKVFLLE